MHYYTLKCSRVSRAVTDARNVKENGVYLNYRYNLRSDNKLIPATPQAKTNFSDYCRLL